MATIPSQVTTNAIQQEDSPKDFPENAEGIAARWKLEIKVAKEGWGRWEKRGKKVVRRFRDEKKDNDDNDDIDYRLNLLWSIVQVWKPSIYSRAPKPEFERRFKDKDPVGRDASEVLERATDYMAQLPLFHRSMVAARDDCLLPGRGTVWCRYKGTEATNDTGQPEIVWEEVVTEPVVWTDFLQDLEPRWELSRWVGRKLLLDKDELTEQFGKKVADQIPLNHADKLMEAELVDYQEEKQQAFKKAEIWEIWSKPDNKIYWICEGYEKALRVSPVILKLKDFFPCPRPFCATQTTDSQIPISDFVYYQDQLEELDNLSTRINLLTESLRLAGVRDASFDALDKLINDTGENALIPIANWAAFTEAGGFEGVLQWMPIREIAEVIQQLYPLRDRVKEDIYELTGSSDILRGVSSPYETKGAQEMKGQFANVRLSERQGEMQRFARDTIGIIAEIIAEQFAPETLQIMTGLPVTPEIMQIFRDEGLRNFKIDIETDSTVALNQEMAKKERLEAVTAIGDFVQRILPAAQQAPELAPFFGEVLTFATRSFKVTRTLENALEEGLQAIMAKAAQPPPPPPPDPNMIRVQNEQMAIQNNAQEAQAKLQLEGQIKQGEGQLKMQEMQAKAQESQAKLQVEQQAMQVKLQEMQAKTQADMAKIQAQIAAQDKELELKAAQFQLETKKVDAEIALKAQELQLKQAEMTGGDASEIEITDKPKTPKIRKARFFTDPATGDRHAEIIDMPPGGDS